MSRPPPLATLGSLTPGQFAECFVLLGERTRGLTREGKPFFTCRFRDNQRTVSCMIWSDGPWFECCEREWAEGRFYRIRVQYGEHERYGPQIDLHQIRPVCETDRDEGFDPSQLVASSRIPAAEMWQQLHALATAEIADLGLQTLVLKLLEKHQKQLLELPASNGKFYPFRGGWLEHVLSVTQNCIRLTDHYRAKYPELQPPLNRDLVVAGAMLHEMGRVLELDTSLAAPQPTVQGKLVGHLILARDLVRDAARDVENLNPELVQLLEHIVLTHLTLPEWGSPRLPLIPEVLILHHLDDLDAKMEMYTRCLIHDVNPGPFTARDPVLGKPLLKQRTV